MVKQEQYAEKVDRQQTGFLDIVENLNGIALEITKDKEKALQHMDFLEVVIHANEVSHHRWG